MANFAEVLKDLHEERGRTATDLKRLDEAIAVLGKLAGRNQREPVRTRARRPRRTMSAAARRKISIAQKARWAKWKVKQMKKAA